MASVCLDQCCAVQRWFRKGIDFQNLAVHYHCSLKNHRLIVSVRQCAEEDVPMQGKIPNVLSIRALRQIITLVGTTCVPQWTTNAWNPELRHLYSWKITYCYAYFIISQVVKSHNLKRILHRRTAPLKQLYSLVA